VSRKGQSRCGERRGEESTHIEDAIRKKRKEAGEHEMREEIAARERCDTGGRRCCC
jgi:hypothetical protein